MSNYNPTVEDYEFLADHRPEVFANPRAALEELRKLRQAPDNTDDEMRMMALESNYRQGGNTPMTESPRPLGPDADGDGVLDVEFASACPDCEVLKPCCINSGHVADASDLSRKLLWPPENEQTKMLVVAKNMEGDQLVAKLDVNRGGRECQINHPTQPSISTTGLMDGTSRIMEKSAQVSVGIQQVPNMVLMLRKYVPENVLYALLAFDATMALRSGLSDQEKASFKPAQCLSDASMATEHQVFPIPYVKMSGTVVLAVRVSFTTGGVNAAAAAKGSLTGQYGNLQLKAEGTTSGTSSTGQAISRRRRVPGSIGTMASVIDRLDHYVSVGNTKDRRVHDLTQYSTGVTLSKTLTFNPSGFELLGKTGSPDLELVLGKMASSLTLGVTGRLDCIDALATGLAGPAGRAIQRARARMASGEYISADLQAYLELGATGTLNHNINSGATVTIPANGEMDGILAGVSQTFGGELKIRGVASIEVRIELDVWIVNAKAGASGTVHTSWKWEMRMHEGRRQKRYEFEGVTVSVKAYAKGTITSEDGVLEQDLVNLDAGFELKADAADLYKQVRDEITGSRRIAEELLGQAGSSGEADDTFYQILRPEETNWEDY